MKILLSVDGSPCSDEAIEETARRPWPSGSQIRVLTAFEVPLPPTLEAWALPPTYFDEMDRSVRAHAEGIIQRAVGRLKPSVGHEVVVEGVALPGAPRVVILDEAESWGADLIIVGSHGYRAWERFLLGSVSQSVVSHAKCSVEVVRCPVPVAGAEAVTGKEKEPSHG
jgi:nucleotide-binding universal stress UspA family protein